VTPDPDEDTDVAGSVTGEWVEVYPPDGEPPDDEPASVAPVTRSSMVAIGLFVVSLVLVVLGSVLPLEQSVAEPPAGLDMVFGINITPWRITYTQSAPDSGTSSASGSLPLGYPLLLAALLLAVAVVLRVRARRAAHGFGVTAAAFLAGMVVMTGAFGLAWRQLGLATPQERFVTEVGSGYWVLVVACLVAVAGAVSGRRSERRDLVERAEGDQPAAGE
jgi:hypothetical protein